MRTITYAVDQENGQVFSRVDSEIAVPILDYGKMLPENNFEPTYYLEKVPVLQLVGQWDRLKWTRKIPVDLKNEHRVFWGMKPLPILEDK